VQKYVGTVRDGSSQTLKWRVMRWMVVSGMIFFRWIGESE
jgi:hypothetical protein